MRKILFERISGSLSDNWKSKIQNRKWLTLSVIAFVIMTACAAIAQAQQTGKVPRIGYLFNTTPSVAALRVEAFRQGLRELGYVEGKNIVLESGYSEGKIDRLHALVAEFVRLKTEVIVTSGPIVTRAAKEATKTIPIVFAQEGDPVARGFVASLARPGGNITGLSTFGPELSGKRLELLKEIVPRLSRVAILGTSTIEDHARFLEEHEPAAGALRLHLQYLDVLSSKDIETAFRAASNGRADAVLVLAGPVLTPQRTQVVELAAKSRLPAIYNFPEFVDAGGLMTYGVSQSDLSRRAATYVDKILKGANPGDLPVEQPAKFELVINLKAAKQIVLTIPPNVLARADRVIR
jgi:putative tryptophan/tyrosine transport system substrate-binding protein